MKFSSEKKQTIILYMLEKIEEKTKSLSRVVSETFGISTNTVHSYINELLADGVINKGKRGEYELNNNSYSYSLKRDRGELENDTYAYDVCLSGHISDLSDNVRNIWSYAFTEMANNVIDHSAADVMNVIVTRNYLRTSVIIADNGVGIFEKIKKHFSLGSLDEAICELFKGKLTTDADNHSGEGIFFTSKMMDLFFISSSGKIFTTSKFENDAVLSFEQELSGTCVFMSLSNFTHKNAHEVFDMYSNSDGGFQKTRIPLKNIFDGAPVSRSQAKRISNRLDDFKEVILDFEDVSWMGQGFAHQLFVVYRNLHPDVSLIALNMNESVENMYKHVTQTK